MRTRIIFAQGPDFPHNVRPVHGFGLYDPNYGIQFLFVGFTFRTERRNPGST